MRKLLFIFGGAALVFAAVYVLKMNDNTPDQKVSNRSELSEKEKQKVILFWEVYRKATRLRIAGKVEEARDAYHRALGLNPRHEDALYYYGNMSLELNAIAAAKQAWETLVKENQESARAFFRLGDLFLDHNKPYFDIDSAAWCYRQALEINKEQSAPVLRLAQVAILNGNRADADLYLDAVLGSNHRSSQAHFLKGYLAWKESLSIDRERKRQLLESLEAEKPMLGVLGEGDSKSGGSLFEGNRHSVFGVDFGNLSPEANDEQLAARHRRLDELIQTMRNNKSP